MALSFHRRPPQQRRPTMALFSALSWRRSRSRPARRRARPPLRLEALEDRTVPSISLAPGEAPPQLVGERIVWTASATDLGANPVYQFRVGPEDGPLHVLRDFSPANSFTWTPMQEG